MNDEVCSHIVPSKGSAAGDEELRRNRITGYLIISEIGMGKILRILFGRQMIPIVGKYAAVWPEPEIIIGDETIATRGRIAPRAVDGVEIQTRTGVSVLRNDTETRCFGKMPGLRQDDIAATPG